MDTVLQRRTISWSALVNQVAPFDAILDWPHEIARVPMEHYAAWMKSAYWISTTLCPAASVPAGFVPEGLPVGIQIVGRRGDDAGVLQVAHAFEQATGHSRRKPALPGGTVKTTARNVEAEDVERRNCSGILRFFVFRSTFSVLRSTFEQAAFLSSLLGYHSLPGRALCLEPGCC